MFNNYCYGCLNYSSDIFKFFKFDFTDTVRKGIIDINSFNGTEQLAMIGSLSALSGTGIWLIVATFFNLPVSGTHSVVGATMGYALVAHGIKGIQWKTFGMIGEVIFNS